MTPTEHIHWGRQYWKAVDKLQGQPGFVHSVVGIASEAGELLDLLKKAKFHTGNVDREDVLDEAGDVLYYMSRLLEAFGSSYEEVMEANKVKLDYRMKIGKDKVKERELQKVVFEKYKVK